MTTLRILGTSPENLLPLAKTRFHEGKDGSMAIEENFRVFKSAWILKCPSRGSNHPIYSNAILLERNASESSIPGMVDVTLVYYTPPDTTGGPATILPPTEYTETASEIIKPIEAHPDFGTFGTVANGAIFDPPIPPLAKGKFKGWVSTSPFVGYDTYSVASVTESITKYSWEQPPSVTDQIGTIQDTYWRVASGSTGRRYPYWVQSILRVYNDEGWNRTIYPD
jgi:hypothetical protein